jgi:UDP-glucose-4-epimerase GalE
MKTALITGGAGYLGSHLCKALKKAGWKTVVYDLKTPENTSYVDAIVIGDIRDSVTLSRTFEFHLAGRIEVGLSSKEPTEFWDVNVGGTVNLLNVMKMNNVKKIIFSSTAGVYIDGWIPIPEEECTTNNSVYSNTKLAAEHAIEDSGMDYIIFRYFNLAGADPEGEMGEDHEPETHLIPLILRNPTNFKVFGSDYDTHDGTCVRDYVHVSDVARAHVLASEHLDEGNLSQIINLGTGEGHSIFEILDLIRKYLNLNLEYDIEPRRVGDPASLVANVSLAENVLNFRCEYDIVDILTTAYEWHKKKHGK